MKKIFLFIIIFLSLNINAQDEKSKEKIRAFKVAYLTDRLDLTKTEAEKFWPIFNKYQKLRRELFNFEKIELKERAKDGYEINNISNEEAQNILNKVTENREKLHDNKITFHKELSKILPAKKILILEITEREFNRKLMHKLKNKSEK